MISKILNNQGEFKAYEQLQDHIRNHVDLMLYNSLKSAIPRYWRQIVNEMNENPTESPQVKQNENIVGTSKKWYWSEIRKLKPLRAIQNLWENELQTVLEENEWDNLFLNIFVITILTRLRVFHYKIINKYLMMNVKRSKLSAVSELCDLCFVKSETIYHLLIDCEKVKGLWQKLEQ